MILCCYTEWFREDCLYDLACLHGHYKCARLLQALIWADKNDRIKVEEHHHSLRTAKSNKHLQRPVERLTTKLEPSSANQLEHQMRKTLQSLMQSLIAVKIADTDVGYIDPVFRLPML